MSPKQRQHFPFGCIAQAWTVCVQFPAYIFNPKMQTSHFINLTVSLMSGLARLSFCVLSVAPSPTHPIMPYPLIWAAILILIVGATTLATSAQYQWCWHQSWSTVNTEK